jgi:hypothetical protein
MRIKKNFQSIHLPVGCINNRLRQIAYGFSLTFHGSNQGGAFELFPNGVAPELSEFVTG